MCKKNELTFYILSIPNFIPIDICEVNFGNVLFSTYIKRQAIEKYRIYNSTTIQILFVIVCISTLIYL